MGGVLAGFASAGAIVLIGVLLAHLKIIGSEGQETLARVVFFVASPALLFVLLADIDVAAMLSSGFLVAALSVVAAAAVYGAIGRRWARGPQLAIGTLCACFVNAGNLGLPIAIYALGDTTAVLGAVLFQVVALTPLSLAFFDYQERHRKPSVGVLMLLPLRNPVTIASACGIAVSLTGWQPPALVLDPVELLSGMSVPCMLLAYGVSLRLDSTARRRSPAGQLASIATIKLVLQPLTAYLIGRYVCGLDGMALVGVTVAAALPTGQNVFIFASRYGWAPGLARDSIMVTTLLSVPVIVAITALVG